MKVMILSAYGQSHLLQKFMAAATSDSMRAHQVVASPEEADIILFVEDARFEDYLFSVLRRHPLVAKYPHKVFMYNDVDRPWCALPGIYCSMPRRYFQSSRQRAFPYLNPPNKYIDSMRSKEPAEMRWLYSFMGARNHPSRRAILQLRDERALLVDTSAFNIWHADNSTKEERMQDYASKVLASMFILCPRGVGTSSYRTYETMEAQRVPVMIADQWVPPSQIDWSFALIIKEHDVPRIPEILRAHEAEAKERGRLARLAWEQNCQEDKIFHQAIEALSTLMVDGQYAKAWPKALSMVRRQLLFAELQARYLVRRMRGLNPKQL